MNNPTRHLPLTTRVFHVGHWLHSWLLHVDDQRIRSHFAHAEDWLRSVDTCTMPADLRAVRLRNLDRLHDYWIRGQFPRNEDRLAWRIPVFIDNGGRACAVASLLIGDGQAELASRIAETANYAAVKEMPFPELGDWVARSGFTLDELARVQCGYASEVLLLLSIVVIVVMGVIAFLSLSHHPSAQALNSLLSLGMTALMVFCAVPRSIREFLKTRHTMDLFALPAILSLLTFLPSALIFALTLLTGSNASMTTLALSIFNMLTLPVSWGGYKLTNFLTRQPARKSRRDLQSEPR